MTVAMRTNQLVDIHAELVANGASRIDDLWSIDIADELADEGTREWERATLSFTTGYRAFADGSVGGPLLQYWSNAGPALDALHRDPGIVTLAGELMGTPMQPVQASYLYYRRGGYCGLHRDRAEFEVQLLVAVAGPVAPLTIHPELAGMKAGELVTVFEAGGTSEGQQITFPRRGAIVLRGSAVPHARPLYTGDQLMVVAGLNYRRTQP